MEAENASPFTAALYAYVSPIGKQPSVNAIATLTRPHFVLIVAAKGAESAAIPSDYGYDLQSLGTL